MIACISWKRDIGLLIRDDHEAKGIRRDLVNGRGRERQMTIAEGKVNHGIEIGIPVD